MSAAPKPMLHWMGALEFVTEGECYCLDLTGELEQKVTQSGIMNGVAVVTVPGSTGSVISIEAESGLLRDLGKLAARLVPKDVEYEHQVKWRDDNGHSHLRASLFGASLVLPVLGGHLALGAWQQLVFVEFDIREHRKRNVSVQIFGTG